MRVLRALVDLITLSDTLPTSKYTIQVTLCLTKCTFLLDLVWTLESIGHIQRFLTTSN